MSKSILVSVIDTPKNCYECIYIKNCVIRDNANRNDFKTWENRPPQCPLQHTTQEQLNKIKQILKE